MNESRIALALTAPAVRMVVVAVFAHRDDEGDIVTEPPVICPVLAIRSRFTNEREIEHSLLIWDDRHGRYGPTLCSPEEVFSDFRPESECAFTWDAIPCPWPHDEDASRLADLVLQLSMEAVDTTADRIITNRSKRLVR